VITAHISRHMLSKHFRPNERTARGCDEEERFIENMITLESMGKLSLSLSLRCDYTLDNLNIEPKVSEVLDKNAMNLNN